MLQQVNLEQKNGEITYDSEVLGEKDLCEAIEDMGFVATASQSGGESDTVAVLSRLRVCQITTLV